MRKRRRSAQKSTAEYAVGYGRPPTWTRFQPGQSGNPNGRPKGARNAAFIAHDVLELAVHVEGDRSKRQQTVRELAYQRLAEKAVSGDIKALNFLLTQEAREHPPDAVDDNASRAQALEIVQAFLDRKRASKGDNQ